MKKYFPHIYTFTLVFVLVFAASGFFFPQTAHAQLQLFGPARIAWDSLSSSGLANIATDILLAPLGWLAVLLLQLASLITYLSGTILNLVVQFTVVDMTKNISEAGAINIAWKTIRDVANMGFIFVLLYAAIQTILGIGTDTKKLIVNIIVVAILINFSLFFTKVVIDASNVLAITFYDAIAPGELESGTILGLSGTLMEPLNLTSLWDAENIGVFDGKTLIIIGVMGTIVSLIAAFVFFAVAIMFVIRFVVLIFVLILSPLAFMGFILPQLNKYKDQWLDALLGQAFFAPIYFMLTWIVIVVSRGLFDNTEGDLATAFVGVSADGNTVTNPPVESVALLVNFIIIIALLIASLIIAKKWADKAGYSVPGLTKWAMGAAGGATLGMAGRLGRNVVGSRAAAMAADEGLKKKAAEGSLRARLQLATASKVAKSSFDLRGAPGGGILEAGKAKTGGFIQDQKDRAKAYEKYKPSKDAVSEAAAETAKAQEALNEARRTGGADEMKRAQRAYEETRAAEYEMASRMENMAKMAEDQTIRGKIPFTGKRVGITVPKFVPTSVAVAGKDKAQAIRAASKGKSAPERAVDALKDLQKEGVIPEEEKPETPPPTPPTGSTPPTP